MSQFSKTGLITSASKVLTASDDTILQAVAFLHYVTANQITRLQFSPRSLSYARAKLKRLIEAGWLQRVRLPSAGAGNTAWVYVLSRKGLSYLVASGFCEPEDFHRLRPVEEAEHTYLFLSHALMVSELLVAATLFARNRADYILVDARHDLLLRRSPISVQVAGETLGIVPDCFMDWHIHQAYRQSVVWELDRGTEGLRSWKRKLLGYLAFAAGPYQTHFHTESLTIAIVCTAGEHRTALLRTWVEQAVREQQAEQLGDLFLLTSLPNLLKEPVNATALFYSPIWHQPFQRAPVSLLLQ